MNNIVVYTDGACSNNGKKNAKCSIGIHFSDNNTIKTLEKSRVFLFIFVSTNKKQNVTDKFFKKQ